eukprot:COSAG06_NODE_21743_length_747_cov_0.783951_1_plen_156_part_01
MDPASPRQRKPLSPHTVPPHRDVRTPEQKRRQHAGKRSPPPGVARSPASTAAAGAPPEGVPKLAATLQGTMEDAGLTEAEMTLLKAEGIVSLADFALLEDDDFVVAGIPIAERRRARREAEEERRARRDAEAAAEQARQASAQEQARQEATAAAIE